VAVKSRSTLIEAGNEQEGWPALMWGQMSESLAKSGYQLMPQRVALCVDKACTEEAPAVTRGGLTDDGLTTCSIQSLQRRHDVDMNRANIHTCFSFNNSFAVVTHIPCSSHRHPRSSVYTRLF